MASIESRLFNLLLALINKKKFLELQFAFGKFDFYNSKEPPKKTYERCHIEKSQINGHNVFTLTPRSAKSTCHILYLHGGAYVQSFVPQHWEFLSDVVHQTRCTISAPDYPLAPKFKFTDAYLVIKTLYRDIVSRDEATNVILMGDSAGGGLALALAQQLRADNLPAPRRIILLSPWLDITLSNPEIQKVDVTDPFLSVNGLRKAGLSFAGETNPSDCRLSPINGSLSGLGDIAVFIGSRDLLVADTRKLKVLAKEANILLDYYEYQDMIHCWMFLNFPESELARKQIMNLVRNWPA